MGNGLAEMMMANILDPNSKDLQRDLDNLEDFTKKNLMVIIAKNPQVMCFNQLTSVQFPPIYNLSGCNQLDIVKQAKLLGIIISDNLKWSAHVDYTCCKT